MEPIVLQCGFGVEFRNACASRMPSLFAPRVNPMGIAERQPGDLTLARLSGAPGR